MCDQKPHCSKYILRHTVQGKPKKLYRSLNVLGLLTIHFFAARLPRVQTTWSEVFCFKNLTICGSTWMASFSAV